jgi:hypothetical protein
METAVDLMRQRGLVVGAFAGWKTAGRSADFQPRALTAHHTAAPIDVDRLLRDGRADLPGPLCNWALHLDGSWWAVASGRANHAGVGVLPSSESYGVECTGPVPTSNTGVDAFPMYEAYVLGVACVCEVEGWDARVVYAHAETARPDGRKPDPAFRELPGDGFPAPYPEMDRFRARVQAKIGQEDEMTPDEFLTALTSPRAQTALKAAMAGIGEDVAANLGPLLARYGAAGKVFVRLPGDNRVYVAESGQLFHVTDPAMFAALSGGEDITTLAMELPNTAPVWDWPVNEVPAPS